MTNIQTFIVNLQHFFVILFQYNYNNCKNIHSKINNGKSNRGTVIIVKKLFC